MGCPFVIDKWHDALPQGRISVLVQLASGNDVHKKIDVRVSTDQLSLVVNMPMSPFLARPEFAFNSYLIGEWPSTLGVESQQGAAILNSHPKIIARKLAVAKIREREASKKDFFYEQRIPLPRKCYHKFADNAGDVFFYGKKFIKYPDGSVHLHVELVAVSGDAFEANKLCPGLVKAHVVPTLVTAQGGTDAGTTAQEQQDEHMNDADDQDQEHHVNISSIVLHGGFAGAARRSSRSVKSAKRTADNQDDGEFSGISGASG